MKKIAVIYYSQSGRTKQVIQRLADNRGGLDDKVSFSFFQIESKKPFAFPWSFSSFFEVFPESVLKTPIELIPLRGEDTYDLILFVYPVWYLSPALPVSSFLQSPEGKEFIKKTPIITIITCRDMWIQAQQEVKPAIETLGSKVAANVVLRDDYNSFQSLVTTLYWFLKGKNQKPFGIFPSPMLKEHQLKKVDLIKTLICDKLQENKVEDLKKIFIEKKIVIIEDYKIFLETRVKKIFTLWAHFVQNSSSPQKRKLRLRFFQLYLISAIVILMPLSLTLFSLLHPFMKEKLGRIRRNTLMESSSD